MAVRPLTGPAAVEDIFANSDVRAHIAGYIGQCAECVTRWMETCTSLHDFFLPWAHYLHQGYLQAIREEGMRDEQADAAAQLLTPSVSSASSSTTLWSSGS